MRKVKIIGGTMTKFGRHMERNLKSLVAEAVQGALEDAGVEKEQLQGAWVGNASQGVLQGQESVRGQVVLRDMGIGLIPVINVENACASSATALHGARAMVALGEMDVALAVGMEKMFFEDRGRVLPAFTGCMDVEMLAQMMKAFGAHVVLVDQMPDSVPGQVSGTDLALVEREAKRLTREHGAFRADQFNNPSTMDAGEKGIGTEIISQLGEIRPDLFIDFMGTGGSFVGVTKALKSRYTDIVCLGVEPENAPFYSIHGNFDGKHQIQGGGYSQRLPFVEQYRHLIDGFVTVSDDEARQTARRLASEECIFAGFSSGANTAAALNLLEGEYRGKIIVVLMPDSGTKYLSTALWEMDV